MTDRTIKKNVDKLGEIKGKIADLQKQFNDIKAKLIDQGIAEAEGRNFKFIATDYIVNSVDYKGLVEDVLQPEDELVDEYTSISKRMRVSVNAR